MSRMFDELRKHRDDRGLMANLRCGLVDSKQHRAWPSLNRLGIRIEDDLPAFVAGLYALHPEETSTGNFGHTCKLIEQRRKDKRGDDNRLTPTERRFQHLLAAERHEVRDRVLRMVKLAKAQNVPVNYERLLQDLGFWNDRTRTEWAAAYWNPESVPANGGEA